MFRTELIRPVPEFLVEHARTFGDKIAFSDDFRGVSYADLEVRTRRLAGHLSALSLEPGDRAAIYLGNRVETVESYLAITRASAIGTPFNPHSTDAELGHLLHDSGARVVITDAGRAEQVRRVLGGGADVWIVVVGDAGTVPTGLKQRVVPFEVLADTDPGVPARDDLGLDEPAWMLYTSGTTGRPKGVLSTQRNCLWSVAACYVPVPGLSEHDRVVWPLPLFHSLAHIFCVLGVTSVGAGARIVSDASAEAVLDVLEGGSYTFLAGVPTMYHNVIRAVRHGDRNIPQLRMCLVGGAVTSPALRREAEETLGAPLIDAYGSTETCGSITINRPAGERVEGSCGLPVPGLNVRLVDQHSGRTIDADADQEGEVWVSGPNVMLGYHNQPEATRAALRDGWYRTGDLAVRDAAGYFRITGRIKELIIRGGENLHPVEVEQVLREVRGVGDAAVVGRPHETLGEVPVAFVVPDAHGVEPEKLFAACREKLSYFKIPEELYEIDSIPRTTSGKIMRHKILERPALLRAAGSGEYDALFRTDWIPLTHTGARPPAADDCAVIGAGAAELRELGTTDAGTRAYADLAKLREAVAAGDDVPRIVLRLVDPPADDPGAALEAAEELSAEARGWLADERCAAARLVVVTRGAVSTGTGQVPDPAQAAVWGAMRSLPGMAEGRVVVADVDSEEGSMAALPTAVTRGEPQLAIRSGIALAPKLARVTAATDGTRYAAPDQYRSVVLTGADTPVAAAVARHLVTVHGTRELLLISPDGEGDPAAADLLDQLAALGATAGLAACDPADRAALEAVLAERDASAVLHVPGPAEATADELRRVLTGAVNMHELTAGTGPFVQFSSSAGLLGAVGEPARAAAAAMLDALAVRGHAAGRPAFALAYGPPWDAGRAAPPGVGTLSERRALAMFDAAHTVHDPSLVAFAPDPDAPGSEVPPPMSQLADTRPVPPDEAAAEELRERLAGLSGRERSRQLVDLVVRETSRLRPGAAVDAARPFRDLGLTSVATVTLCRRLMATTGLTLPTTLAFDHPTPTAVAELLRTSLFGRDEPAAGEAAPKPDADEPVAIVAMGCRLPGGVSSPEDLWRLVESGADAVSEFPDDRGWPLAELFGDSGTGGTGRAGGAGGNGPNAPLSSTRQAAFLDDVAGFDAPLFAVSPREAQAIDPQQRLLLEVAWEVFERAAVDPMSLRGEKVGVFTGLMHHDYAGGDTAQHEGLEGHRGVGKAGSVASGRIAYTFGLEGPAVTVDTACSSSLVSMHLAAQSLRGGDCDLALAGGVAVMSTPTTFIEFSQQGALSADGRCKAFADAADGTGWSEGVGLVLLERLSDARANGHRVLAVVRGSAVNQDGASNGLTAPNGPSQERVIRQALASAGLSGADVDCVEGHGTGTTLGDPIEANALLATYGQGRAAGRPLWLGSVKSNIGHTQAAAGVTGVIKMVQAMQYGRLPRTLHVDRPSSHVDWSAGSVELLTEARAWPEVDRPRRAGVSSFGVSGTNAHVIVEQAPPSEVRREPAGGGALPWIVSGQSEAALRAQAQRLGEFAGEQPESALPGMGRVLALSRAALPHRAVVPGEDPSAGLTAVARGTEVPGVVSGVADVSGRVVFVFPGQGTQWVGMGAELLDSSPVFAGVIAECAEALSSLVDWSLVDVLRDGTGLERVDVVQPASFAVMVALAAVWRAHGVEPDAVLGHSQGEIAAAVVSGALSLGDGVRVVALRSRLIGADLAGLGGMVSVSRPVAEVRQDLEGFAGVEVAAVNGPSSTVVAGDVGVLDELLASCEERGVRARRIAVDYASHTSHVERIEGELLELLAEIGPGAAATPMFSSVLGRWVEGGELDGAYWYRNLRRQVRFADAVVSLVGEGYRAAVEVSAHPVLTGAVRDVFDDHCEEEAVVVGTLRREEGGPARLRQSLSELWVRGVAVDWAAVFEGVEPPAEPAGLPTYAFQHQRYWLNAPTAASDVGRAGLQVPEHPLLGAELAMAGTGTSVFTGRLSVREHPWLADHRVADTVLMPGTAWLDPLFHIGERMGSPVVEELTILSPVTLPEDGAIDVQTVVEPAEDGRSQVRVHTRHTPEDAWTEAARATLAADGPETRAEPVQWPPAGARELDLTGFYDGLAADYGPAFQAVTAVWLTDEAAYAEIRLPETGDDDGYGAHPVLMDALLHPLDASGLLAEPGRSRLAFSWSGCRLAATDARWLRVRLTAAGPDAVALAAVDADGRPVLDIDRLVVRPVDTERLRRQATAAPNSLFEIAWVPVAVPGAAPDWAFHDEVREAAELPPVVVHVPEADADDVPVPQRVRATGLRVLRVLQEWLADPRTENSRLVFAIPPDDLILDAVRGLLRTAESEHPGRFALLETDTPETEDRDALASGLALTADEPHVAVKDGATLAARLTRVTPPDERVSLAGGTVLVTGATGGLGRLVSEHLVHAHGVAELILVSRRGAEQEWVDQLAEHGTTVRSVAADAGDRAALARIVDEAGDRLTGVVHAAGIVEDAVLTGLDEDRWHSVLRTKVDAAWHLHELTEHLPLKAFVLYSSASATFGGAGQGNYATGNAFLDVLARHRAGRGLPAVSLAWGLWDAEVGMGSRIGAADLARMARHGTEALSAQEGLALFDAALAAEQAALVPIRLDLAALRSAGAADGIPPVLRALVPAGTKRRAGRDTGQDPASDPTGLAGLDPAERKMRLLELVRGAAAAVLGHDAAALDLTSSFKELGVDSLLAVELRNRLSKATGVRLSATLVFDHPTPKAVVTHLAGQFGEAGEESAGARRPASRGEDEDPVAIVAMGCRLPGGISSPESLWRLVAADGDAITEFPADRGWPLAELYDPDADTAGKTYVRGGGFLRDVADFDPSLFRITPREALTMDPQQRHMLEIAWETLERAGIAPTGLAGSATGVFIGTHGQDYGTWAQQGNAEEGHLIIGKAASVLSGRISYAYGFEGPALTVDTACSSSLVSMHLAAQSLRRGECDLALAGGVSIMSTLGGVVGFSRQRGLAADGRCKAFADAADGFGMAEGAGLLLLERLSDAQANGHQVLALLRGSAVNQDGASNGLTAPSGPSQERVIRQALASAGLSAADVDCVEGHGTGTALGDPIEAQALLATYGQDRAPERPLWLGSVKSNIGHTQAAAGVTGVIKMVQAMRHGQLPRTLHVDEPSSHVDWSLGGVEVLTEARAWPEADRPRRAGVSSFGVSGTNAHVILEQPAAAPAVPEAGEAGEVGDTGGPAALWAVSGQSDAALRAQAGRLGEFVRQQPDPAAPGIGRALALSRAALPHRAVVVGDDPLSGLDALAHDTSAPDVVAGVADVSGRLAFVFPGQGTQWAGMGAELLDSSPVFAGAVAECAAALSSVVDWSLVDVLRHGTDLDRVDVVQPASFAVMVALAELWRSHGVEPDAVLGHSQGEIAAAVVCGALSLADGVRVVALRSRLIATRLAGRGGMMSVARPVADVEQDLGAFAGIEVAAVNGPASTVVAGETGALEELLAFYEQLQVRARRIAVDYASHTSHVERIETELLEVLGEIAPRAPRLPMFSATLGRWIEGPELDGAYWYRNLRQRVGFADAVRALLDQGHRTVVEVSAHPVLTGAVQDLVHDHCADSTVVVGTLRRDEGGPARFHQSLAELWVRGVTVDWAAVFDGVTQRPDPAGLPTYAFQRQRYWLSAPPARNEVTGAGLAAPGHPLLDAELTMANGGTRVFTGRLDVRDQPWQADHRVGGVLIVPGTAWLDLLFHIGDRVGSPTVEELTVLAPTTLPEDGGTDIQVVVEAAGGDESDDRHVSHVSHVSIHTRTGPEDAWTETANATLTAQDPPPAHGIGAWPPPGAEAVQTDGFYEGLAADYGPAFRAVRSILRDADATYAEVRLPEAAEDGADGEHGEHGEYGEDAGDAGDHTYGAHPALLDALLHPLDVSGLLGEPGQSRLAFSWSGCHLYATGARSVRVRLTAAGTNAVALTAVDEAGLPVVSIDRLTVRPVETERLRQSASAADMLFDVSWVPAEATLPTPEWAFHEDVREAEQLPPVVVHVPDTGSDDVGLPDCVRTVGFRVLRDLQAWLADPRAAESRLVLATRPGELVTEPLRGLLRTAASENPGRFGLLDLDSLEPDAIGAGLAVDEPEVSVRDGSTRVPRLTRVDEPAVPGSLEGETVLVTGATGGLGRWVTEHLVHAHGVAELILVSRRGAEQEWVDELAAAGATVRSFAADVCDREALAGIIDETGDRLTAVVHTAGIVDDGVLTSLDEHKWHSVLRTKIDAAWHLHELTEHLPLKAFVLYSAAAATFGNAGQGNYTTGNAFLDALARHRAERGLPAQSLAWGLWEGQAGMGSRLGAADRARMARQGTRGFPPEQGLAAFDAALSVDRPVLVPVRVDTRALRDSEEIPPLLRALAPTRTRRRALRRDEGEAAQDTGFAALPPEQLREKLLDLVRSTTATAVGHRSGDDIPAGNTFQDLGIDSLLAVELRNRLNKATGIRLPATLVFDHPTPQELAAHLAGLLGEEATAGQETAVQESAAAPESRPDGADAADDPIAIVAMGCRLPGGVDSPEDLWRLVEEGGNGISAFPADREWLPDPAFGAESGIEPVGGFLDSATAFDPELFRLSPREAETMDPQQRQLLEVAWETIESAGMDPTAVRGRRIGVFAGLVHNGYADHVDLEGHLGVGSVSSVATGRIAYTFGLEGPAVTVDTACSSSLVALHLAAQSVRSGDSELALAGGVAVMTSPATFANYLRQDALAPDGRCKSFAEGADGMAMSEGVGLVLLERLSDARREGHRVLAVLRGSAVNQDGASNGLTAPSGRAQERVIRQALANARSAPAGVDAVEGHGTGTPLGDPIEVNALLAAYGQDRDPGRPLWLGSVKSNIGHSQAAGGVAGVIKMVQAIRHGVLPPTLHVDEPTSGGEWETGAVELLTEATPWPEVNRPRRGGVSSFGVSGTNAHVILEQAPDESPEETLDEEPGEQPGEVSGGPGERAPAPSTVPWVLSGSSPEALREQAGRLAAFLAGHPRSDRVDVGFSLALKARLEHRAVVTAEAGAGTGALEALRALAAGEPHPALALDGPDDPELVAWFASLGALRTELPTYAFQRQRYWLSPAGPTVPENGAAEPAPAGHDAAVTDPEALRDRLAGLGGGARRELLVEVVRTALADFTDDAAGVTDDANFFELDGFSSLQSVQFRNRLNEILGRRLPVTIVFNNPTPASLAESLLERLDKDGDASKVGGA